MKKIFVVLCFILTSKTFSQNLQLHYDFGDDRKYFTSTLEMFKPDEYGSTFFFVDFDYDFSGNNGISLVYFEIARYINIYKQIALTFQYNDGLAAVPIQDLGNIAVTLNQTFLAGISYPVNIGFMTLDTELLYRKTYGSRGADGQFAMVWLLPVIENKVLFTGYLNVWSQDEKLRAGTPGTNDKEIVFLTEPQIWYNIDKHISVGTEIEISNNFLPFQKEIKIMPTLGVKWNF